MDVGILIEFSKENKMNMTPSEKRVAKWMREQGILFKSQVPIVSGDKGYIADFVLKDNRLPRTIIIEVDGSAHNGAQARERDRLRTQNLERQGWRVFRLRNEETYDPEKIGRFFSKIFKEFGSFLRLEGISKKGKKKKRPQIAQKGRKKSQKPLRWVVVRPEDKIS